MRKNREADNPSKRVIQRRTVRISGKKDIPLPREKQSSGGGDGGGNSLQGQRHRKRRTALIKKSKITSYGQGTSHDVSDFKG